MFRKFADIANTVERQFNGGIYKIREWADLITAHTLPGPEMITHLSSQSDSTSAHTCGCVVILEMSTKNSLTTPEYCKGIRQLKGNALHLNLERKVEEKIDLSY